MDSALPSHPLTISHEEFYQFHRIDRQLYFVLVINLYRDPFVSMQVLAMWIWLERQGYGQLVKKITSLPHVLINEVADETVSLLNYINTTHFSYFSYSMPNLFGGCDISLLQSITQKDITASLLYDKRDLIVQGVVKIMHNVCARAFSDIMQQAIRRNTIEKMAEEQIKMAEQSVKTPSLLAPQQQQPFWFGSGSPLHLQSVSTPIHGAPDYSIQAQTPTQKNNVERVPAKKRTLFLTFSKRYPVEESEVREFFTMAFGDIVETLYMQEVQPHEQPLFAQIVFRNPSIIDMIIKGSGKAKFSINGKHVWACKFVHKRKRTMTYNNCIGESSGIAGPK